ncbi:MAG: excinuclease subunit [Bacteroidota bacterium]|jgi:excinuclease ABC subunit A
MSEKVEKIAEIDADEIVVDTRREIFIKGARSNNLQNIDLRIPRNKLVVVTGVSGSGKSSITMDTLYAEGQRRYVESLSSYARQFLMRMKKPDVDYIKGVCPAIAIEQKVTTGNNRSTVGSMTETYDFMRLLFARIGKTYSPVSGELVKRHQVSDVVDYALQNPDGTRILLFIPLQQKYGDRLLENELNILLQKGYTRLAIGGTSDLIQIEDFLKNPSDTGGAAFDIKKMVSEFKDANIRILIDRFAIAKEDEDNNKRIGDSVQTAFYEAEGECIVEIYGTTESKSFNNRFELDDILFVEPTPQLFNYNNSLGACPVCEGYGKVMGIDEDKVIPDKSLSLVEGAVAAWRGEKGNEWLQALLRKTHQFDFPIHTPYAQLTKAQQKLIWSGNAFFQGIDAYFAELESQTYKIQNRVMLARYRGRTTCKHCEGKRLRPEATYVKIHGHEITELLDIPIDEVKVFFDQLQLDEHDTQIGKRLLLEINNRLDFMQNVGLGYLTLSRVSATLSGGETQRINLTRTLGSNLTSSMYLLDEPSVGLHPRDTAKLITVLKKLRDLGNTVIVVEHEEEVIKQADYLVDIGPEAGVHGGHLVFAGKFEEIFTTAANSLTAKYMNGSMKIEVPTLRRKWSNKILLKNARLHNLKNVSVTIPLNTLTVVTGVSGSGKTTLVKQILHPALQAVLEGVTTDLSGAFDGLEGDMKLLSGIELINQSPIGKSSRSNPVTYVKAYDHIRDLFAKQTLSKVRGYKPGHFSFNTDGGRCDACKGEGEQVVEMQFLADVHLLCESCNGKRFKNETLDVQYKGKNIYDVLEMNVEEAIEFFKDEKDILSKIRPLFNVGLGYVQLGQSSSTLSGGEAQRVKLASFLTRETVKDRILFIFDEPTTGLHFHDIKKLLDALNALVEKGHSVLVVEHNAEVIKSADWVIDMGPEGGKNGGNVVFQGTPEGLAACENSYTGHFLKEKLK